jgi:hypothetical protein
MSGSRVPSSSSPFMGWLYDIFPVDTFSALLGVFELADAVLLATKPLAPKLSIAGSVLAIVLFVSTVSFLFTTPDVSEPAGGGFPALSLTDEFLLKDIPLLGLSFWTRRFAARCGFRVDTGLTGPWPVCAARPRIDVLGVHLSATTRSIVAVRWALQPVPREWQSEVRHMPRCPSARRAWAGRDLPKPRVGVA